MSNDPMKKVLNECLSCMGWDNYSDDELKQEEAMGNEAAAIILRARAAVSCPSEEDKLVEFFRSEGYSRFGWDGDQRGWSPAETAINAMRRLVAQSDVQGGQPQSPSTGGKAFHQIAHDEGKPDLAALWQAVIDNTKGGGFWLGELLLTTIEQETGFSGTVTRPDREGKNG